MRGRQVLVTTKVEDCLFIENPVSQLCIFVYIYVMPTRYVNRCQSYVGKHYIFHLFTSIVLS